MARKRMIDPEFWSDEKIASLSSDCKLLFIGLWNFADDEGIFKAHPSLLASQIFPYEEGMGKKIDKYLEEIKNLNLVFCYALTGQKYGIILNFKRHQTISHPQPSQLPKPSIQSKEYRLMIYARDNYICVYCHNTLNLGDNTKFTKPTLDHIVPRSKGGSDLPENLITSCESCNKSKGTKDFEEFMELSGNDTGMIPPNRIEENRIEENRKEKKRSAEYTENPQCLELINAYNSLTGKTLRTGKGFEDNFLIWIKIYTLAEIIKALEVAVADPYWKEIITPDILLRTKDKHGSDVDRVGQFLAKASKTHIKPKDNLLAIAQGAI